MARNVYGLDLGTYEIKVYDYKKNNINKVKNTLAIKDKSTVIAVGDDAYKMYEKTPPNIEIIFPMKEGVISQFHDMQYLFNTLLSSGKSLVRGSDYVIAVPTDVTQVEKKAFYDLLIQSSAKAKNVLLIERCIADTLGLGINIEKKNAICVVNLGSETTEISILSYGGIVLNKLIKRGAQNLDLALQNLLKQQHNFLIGNQTAALLRKTIGCYGNGDQTSMFAIGRNLDTGIPEQREISNSLLLEAWKDCLEEIIYDIRSILERTPPDIQNYIKEDGIYFVGGLSSLFGLDTYISKSLEIPINITNHPENNTTKGISKIIKSKNKNKLAYSMMGINDRWIK